MAASFRRSRRFPLGVALILLLLVVLRSAQHWTASTVAPSALAAGEYQVQRVVDGDTLLLENQARVRLIGVDTPETVKRDHPIEPWGPEASEFTRKFIGTGSVRIELDTHDRVDTYDRFLAYVYVGDKMLNEELLRAGLARARTRFGYGASYKRLFVAAEDEAKNFGRGIWSDDPPSGGTPR